MDYAKIPKTSAITACVKDLFTSAVSGAGGDLSDMETELKKMGATVADKLRATGKTVSATAFLPPPFPANPL